MLSLSCFVSLLDAIGNREKHNLLLSQCQMDIGVLYVLSIDILPIPSVYTLYIFSDFGVNSRSGGFRAPA